jgi:hypothetical protein
MIPKGESSEIICVILCSAWRQIYGRFIQQFIDAPTEQDAIKALAIDTIKLQHLSTGCTAYRFFIELKSPPVQWRHEEGHQTVLYTCQCYCKTKVFQRHFSVPVVHFVGVDCTFYHKRERERKKNGAGCCGRLTSRCALATADHQSSSLRWYVIVAVVTRM